MKPRATIALSHVTAASCAIVLFAVFLFSEKVYAQVALSSSNLANVGCDLNLSALSPRNITRTVANIEDEEDVVTINDISLRRTYSPYESRSRFLSDEMVASRAIKSRLALDVLMASGCVKDVASAPPLKSVLQDWSWTLAGTLRQRDKPSDLGQWNLDYSNLTKAAGYLGYREPPCDSSEACLFTCEDTAGCVLEAELLLARAEKAQSAPEKVMFLRKARLIANAAIRTASLRSPTLDSLEAWMVLSEINATPGADQLDSADVLAAYALLQAIRRSESERDASQTMELPGIKDAFDRRLLPIYQHAADALYQKSQGDEGSLIPWLLELGEAERETQIEVALSDGCDPPTPPFQPKELQSDETILYPVVGAQRVYLLTATKSDGWRLIKNSGAETRYSAADVEANANSLLSKFSDISQNTFPQLTLAGSRAEWGSAEAARLYDALIEPLNPLTRWPSTDTIGTNGKVTASGPVLIIFPDPVLRSVPWAALRSGKFKTDEVTVDLDFLIRRVAIASAPALSYVREPPVRAPRGPMLVSGSNRTNAPDIQSCDSVLPQKGEGLQQLACGIARGHLRKHIRLGPVARGFTNEGLSTALQSGGFSSLLIAAHAQFDNGQPVIFMQPANRTAGSQPVMGLGDLAANIKQTRLRDGALELLLLVSCEGAQSNASSLGLAGAALRSGAITTLGALVPVPQFYPQNYITYESNGIMAWGDFGQTESEAPGQAKRRFLEDYFAGVGPAEALRRVQLHYLLGKPKPNRKGAYVHLNHPAAWGSYVIVGWWR